MHLLKVCINLFLLILVPLNIVSQTISVRKFSTSDGLLSNSINDCNFDKNGFLWIATQASLSRFDGRMFKNHTSNNFEGIKSNRFKVIYKLKNGNLIAKNFHKQFFLINEKSELTLIDSLVYGVDYLETSDKKIFFLKKGGKLKLKIDLLSLDDTNLFYITEDYNCYQVLDSFILFNKTTKIPSVNHTLRSCLSFVMNNNFYTITKDKRLLVFHSGKLIKTYNLNTIFDVNNYFTSFYITSNNGLHSLNVNKDLYTITEINNELKFNKEDIQSTDNEILTKLNHYNKNNSIIYSNINGVSFLQPQLMNISELSYNGTNVKATYRVLTNKNSEVFSAIHHKQFSHLRTLHNTSLSFNIGLDTICLIHQNSVYYSVNNKLYHYQLEFTKNSPSNNEFKDVFLDNSKVYITSDNIVFEFIKPNKLKPFIYLPSKITATCLMKDKKYWLIGTTDEGVFKYNSQNKTFIALEYFVNKDIRSIKYDSLLNKYWVFTYGSGIYWLDKNLKASPFQRDKNGYLDFAHYYLKDTLENYWIVSNNGLFRYEKKEIIKRNTQSSFKIHYQYFSDENRVSENEFNGGFYNSGLILLNGHLAFSSKEGIVTINPYQLQKEETRSPIVIDEILFNESVVKVNSFYTFKEGYFSFELTASSPNFNFGISSNIEYKIPELNINWESLEDHKLKLYSLKRGEYNIYLRKTGSLDSRSYKIITINVLPPWYATNIAFVIYFFSGLTAFIITSRIISRNKKEKIKSDLQLIESELKALRTQINPHYLSNSLIGLQNSIMDGNYEKSIKFISTFSKVMRNMLFNSEKSITPLENEINIIRDYVALENINRDQYVQFHVHKEFSTFYKLSDIQIPTNVLQPLIENAFIHGFTDYLNRSLYIQININISYDNLLIEIIDNGIGYKPTELKKDSYGLKNLKLVIQKLQVKFNKTLKFEIANRTDAQGTIVHLNLPLITNDNNKKQA
jgi:hypothetical protein